MCDEWMPTIKLAMSPAQFRELQRNPAYRYDYLDGEALLSPRAKHYHAVLDLAQGPAAPEPLTIAGALTVRPVGEDDWSVLPRVFADAFRHTQPFACLDDNMLREAARQSVARTRIGNDGPLIESASFLAEQAGHVVGAALITLIPHGDPCQSESYRWHEPPPPDAIARRQGRAHLTWIFVAPMLAGKGAGSALLHRVTQGLRRLGFEHLLSTFVLGNDSSMLWHWRCGFELLSYPTSYRLRRQRKT
jgi:GNAT superfamily N-acetyltransferase